MVMIRRVTAALLRFKQIPRNQELYKKDLVFLNPASIGPNLKEMVASYQQIFNVR